MKLFNLKVANVGALVVGKTYYKNVASMGYPPMVMLKLKIISEDGSNVNVTIGKDTTEQTITKAQCLLYINCRDGYGDEI